MNLQQKLSNEKLVSLKGQLAYCFEKISQNQTKSWERKEYYQTATNLQNEITNLTNLIKQTS